MKKFFSFLAIAALASCLYAPQAQARPQYVKGLQEAYSKNTAIGEKKCGVCHGKGGADKKVVSDYDKTYADIFGAGELPEAAK